jgi:putative membrane protein
MSDRTPDRQLELAQERTDAAHQRTQLAEERTFSAWIRTGLASLATGLAIAKLMTESGPGWLIGTLGTLFIVVGGVLFGLAFEAYYRTVRRRGASPTTGVPIWVLAIITLALLVGAAVGLALVFLE